MKNVHILQPYVPGYRVPFFESLQSRLLMDGVQIRVFAGSPVGEQAGRGDASSQHSWEVRISQQSFQIGRKRITFPKPGRGFSEADGVIVGLVGSLPQAHLGALASSLGRRRLGLWGHVKAYTAPANQLDMALERMLMKRSDQVFAYTPGGAEFARESGVNLDRITTVMNTLDTSYASQALAPDTVLAFRERWGLRPGERVYGYIGGLDASKRVGFLAESLDRLWEIDRSARVLVAGEGRDADLLSSHVNRGQVVRLGFADNSTKAAIGAVSSAILMPGRIGLIACDALALGVPLVSTRWPFHAPEAEYLQEGDSVFYAADEPADFARVVHGGAFVRRKRTVPSLEQMTENFAHGVHRMLA